MPWLMAQLYDWSMRDTEAACLRAWREELLSGVAGELLEIGAGTGANVPFYPEAVSRAVLFEPDPHMRKKLSPGRFELTGAMPADAETFDVAISTLVLCTVPEPAETLAAVHRALRPGGELRFLEHVVSPDDEVRRTWQRRIEPFWKIVAGGCHLTRDTAASIEAAGFEIESLQRASMRKAPSWVRPTIRGVAKKRRA